MNGWLGEDCRARKKTFKILWIVYFSFQGSCGSHGLICHNNGKCVRSSNSTDTCQCEHPWSGPTCEER